MKIDRVVANLHKKEERLRRTVEMLMQPFVTEIPGETTAYNKELEEIAAEIARQLEQQDVVLSRMETSGYHHLPLVSAADRARREAAEQRAAISAKHEAADTEEARKEQRALAIQEMAKEIQAEGSPLTALTQSQS